jgi:glycosyltransferase involved in cell wall biosynthesis
MATATELLDSCFTADEDRGTRALRVLAIAYACNPERGSEDGVGWGWVSHIAERHQVLVITADFQRPAIERWQAANPEARQRIGFAYVPSRPWHYRPEGTWLKIEVSIFKPLMNLAYQHWLGEALRVARNEARNEQFDLVHLITYVGYRFPGKFWTIGLPFVWGPIGGMENTPWRLLPLMGFRGAVFYAFRNIVNSLQLRFLSGPKSAFAAGDGCAIAATSGIQAAISKHYKSSSTVICEVGPPDIPSSQPLLRESRAPLVICWSGTHLPGKALPLLLRALATLRPEIGWRLKVLGDGPCMRKWRRIAERLGIDSRCEWQGWISRSESLAQMRASHAFAITSLKDLTSTVALEALSLGLPVICLDHCGFADLVTADCGIKIPAGSPKEIYTGFAAAVEQLWSDESERRRLAAGAVARTQQYSWRNKLDALDDVYRSAVGRRVIEHEARLGYSDQSVDRSVDAANASVCALK